MSAKRRLAFALGSPGYMSIDRVAGGILLYFYLPPPDRGLEAQVSEQAFLGALTAFGVATIIARTVGSVAAPLIGHASDRSRSPLGRRRSYMIYGLLPMSFLPLLAYWPPGPAGSTLNALWLTLVLSSYYLFSTMYTAPHAALVPEIGRDDEDRARLSRVIALAAFPVGGLLMAWPRGIDWGHAAGLDAADSIRCIVVVLAVSGFMLCAAPIFALDEHRFANSAPSDLSFREALSSALRNHAFRVFLSAHVLFSLATSLIFPALPYIATVLLGRNEGFAFELAASLAVMLGFGYVVMPRLVRYTDSKRLMIGCFALFAVASAALGLIRPDAAEGPSDAWNLSVVFVALGAMGLPLAGMSIMPNVLLGQIIDRDAESTGVNHSAVYLGLVQAFDKWAYGLGAAVIAFLFASFGKSPAEPNGVLLIGPFAGVFGLFSAVLFAYFPRIEPVGEEAEAPPLTGSG